MFAEHGIGGMFRSLFRPAPQPPASPPVLRRTTPRKAVCSFLRSLPRDPHSYVDFLDFCAGGQLEPISEDTFRYNLANSLEEEAQEQRPVVARSPAPRRNRREARPTPRREPSRLKEFPADVHARQLLARIEDTRDPSEHGILRTPEIQEIYLGMCTELGWRQRPWNPVAHQFTQLTTGTKVYDNVLVDGVIRKLRIYPVSTPDRACAPWPDLQPATKKVA